MKRIYEATPFARRLNIYVAILVAAMANGVWEIWSGLHAVDGSTNFAFGALFILGGAYGLYQTYVDGADLVAAFDIDQAAGMGRITLWRPFQKKAIEERLDRFTNWRFWVKAGQGGARTKYFYATIPGYPRKLAFELRQGFVVSDELRPIAGEAIADYERAMGLRQDED